MNVFELVIDEDQEDSGVLEIALVDAGAIESNWIAFSKNKLKSHFKVDNEKRIISGWAMKADLKIPRIGEDGEQFHVWFGKETIEKIVYKYMREERNNEFNIMHTQQKAAGVYLIESILRDSTRGSKAPDNFEDAPDGSWFISAKVDDDATWKEIQDGTYMGWSVEGFFNQTKPVDMDEAVIEKARDLIKNYARAYADSCKK